MDPHVGMITARWAALPWPPAANPAKRRSVLAELVDAHRSSGRRYHTLTHIADLLGLSNRHAANLDRREIVDLAIFFHDAVYHATRRDNEEASARLAHDRLAELCWPADAVAEVERFIVATKHAEPGASAIDGDLAWFLDFDLSILASDRESYARYSEAIRREYAAYPDAVYSPGRRGVLEAFLSRPRIYATGILFERWEGLARSNIAWELARLRSGDT